MHYPIEKPYNISVFCRKNNVKFDKNRNDGPIYYKYINSTLKSNSYIRNNYEKNYEHNSKYLYLEYVKIINGERYSKFMFFSNNDNFDLLSWEPNDIRVDGPSHYLAYDNHINKEQWFDCEWSERFVGPSILYYQTKTQTWIFNELDKTEDVIKYLEENDLSYEDMDMDEITQMWMSII